MHVIRPLCCRWCAAGACSMALTRASSSSRLFLLSRHLLSFFYLVISSLSFSILFVVLYSNIYIQLVYINIYLFSTMKQHLTYSSWLTIVDDPCAQGVFYRHIIHTVQAIHVFGAWTDRHAMPFVCWAVLSWVSVVGLASSLQLARHVQSQHESHSKREDWLWGKGWSSDSSSPCFYIVCARC